MSVSAVHVPVGPTQPGALEGWIDAAGNLVIPAAALPQGGRGGASVLIGRGRSLDGAALSLPRRGLLAIAAASALLVVVTAVFAAFGRQWAWTGFAGSTSLWSWLRLLVQPVALAYLTVRLIMGVPRRVSRTAFLTGAILLAILILAGYSEHWGWTGFSGKALWDWLTLLLFPAVVVLLPEWIRRGEPLGPVARLGALVAIGVFALLLVGGYRWGWTWTGFTGNTFRDWLDLMIAPFLIPLALKVVHTLHGVRSASHAKSAPSSLVVQVSVAR